MSKVETRRKNIDSASRVYATETNHSQSIADECIPAYEDLKKHKYKFVIYKIGRDSKIYVEQEGENYPGSEHVDFTKTLPQDECRYAAYSFDYEYGSAQAKRSKLLLVFWARDLARVKVSWSLISPPALS